MTRNSAAVSAIAVRGIGLCRAGRQLLKQGVGLTWDSRAIFCVVWQVLLRIQGSVGPAALLPSGRLVHVWREMDALFGLSAGPPPKALAWAGAGHPRVPSSVEVAALAAQVQRLACMAQLGWLDAQPPGRQVGAAEALGMHGDNAMDDGEDEAEERASRFVCGSCRGRCAHLPWMSTHES